MNSTELVRFPIRGVRPLERPKKKSPPLVAELVGPARNAIVRARHSLVSQQKYDGTWVARQPGDVSLLSQLVLLAAYSERENLELAQQCAATIEHYQQPEGAWSTMPGGAADVSTSVQAYFALKLAGHDPTDERMHLARKVIRQFGGADAADAETRYLLALFGQIDYDQCQPMPPHSALQGAQKSSQDIPMSIIWSHRPVCRIAVERGIRELFLTSPCDWPVANATESTRKFSRRINQSFEKFIHVAVRRNTTVAQRRALERCQTQLLSNVHPTQVSQFDLHELIWHTLALHAIGYSLDSDEQASCAAALEKLVEIDHESELVCPSLKTAALAGTAIAIRALAESGMSTNHPAIEDGLNYLQQAATAPSPTATSDVSAWTNSLLSFSTIGAKPSTALPPNIDIRWDWQYSAGDADSTSESHRDEFSRATASCQFRLWEAQNSDGGWASMRAGWHSRLLSEAGATGEALESFARSDNEQLNVACELGRQFLLTCQHGDGSWAMPDGSQSVPTTSAAIRGLLAAGQTPSDDCIAAAVHWLIIEQQSNGTWCDNVSQTAQAVLGLVAAGHVDHSSCRRAIQFLVKAQHEEGTWTETIVSESSVTLDGALESTCWPLLALSRYAVAATSSQSEILDHQSLRLVATADEI